MITSPPGQVQTTVMSTAACLFVNLSVYLLAYLENYTTDLHQIFTHVASRRRSVLLIRRGDTLCTLDLWVMWRHVFTHGVPSVFLAKQPKLLISTKFSSMIKISKMHKCIFPVHRGRSLLSRMHLLLFVFLFFFTTCCSLQLHYLPV